jgi:ATP-dependent exoDNAse (exonuclease V) beta subunit
MSNFVVYKSSAGSGKTFTLVKEYLKLALHDERKISFNFKKILAVTFTNKAAAEMKQRVIGALIEISSDPFNSGVGKLIADDLKLQPEALGKRASILLSHILHNYSDFSIGTIDSFTHKIVKTFAYDLNLPVNFNLETDVDSFYEKVVSELFGLIGEDEFLTRLLKNYSFNKAEENAFWDPEKQILDFVKLLQKENADEYLDKLKTFSSDELENFRKQFIDFTKAFKDDLKQKASAAFVIYKDNNLTEKDLWYEKAGPFNFFNKCFEGSVEEEDISGNRLQKAMSSHKWLKEPGNESLASSFTSIALELCEYISKHYKYYLLCQLLIRQIYPLMLIKKLEELSVQKKLDEQIVFISEFNKKIFDLINNEPTPFIYERLGEKYHHYLLDEFQDTSGLQWQNILPLLDNSLANGWFNLIVGDGKQSIYRWRNANVKQFAELPQVANFTNSPVIEERKNTLVRNYKQEILNTNYRSVKTIVEFNNSLFDALNATLLSDFYASIYHEQSQKLKNLADGYITILPGKVKRDELDETNLKEIKFQIDNSLENGYKLGDICIICRYNFQGSLIADYLVQQGVPVVSSDSLLLANKLEINTLVSFLTYINNKQNRVAGSAVLNYLLHNGKINNNQFNAALINAGLGKSLFEILLSFGITIHENDLSLGNLFDNCLSIIKALELNKTAPLYIRFFLDEVNEFLVTKNSNLPQFLQWWENRAKKASVIIPENTDAVRIMTVHTSKGLEFPVVIIPYCNWPQYRATDSWVKIEEEAAGLPVAVISLTEKIKKAGLEQELEAEKNEQTLDNLNLLYVAFTRAVERLHIITASSVTNKQALVSEWLETYLSTKYILSDDRRIIIGMPQLKPEGHKKVSHLAFELDPLSFVTAENIIRIKTDFAHGDKFSETARRQGVIYHWILSKINHIADIDKAIEAALLAGYIRREEEKEMRDKILAVLSLEKLRHLFEGNVLSKVEAELITPEGEVLRPDRIAFTEENTVLIDYKTGKQNQKKYFAQMIRYEQALFELTNKPVKKLLVYIDEMEVVEV